LFDRHSGGESAILVHIDFQRDKDQEDCQEFIDLVCSAGLDIKELVTAKRYAPHPKFFTGSGKIEEIAELVKLHNADAVLFNHALSPSQERNIEAVVEARVIDRTGLILDIFAQRAHSFEGKLQVELAQLKHLSTRLIRGWTHLERQKGGIGLRGPGETQLETDRRLLRDRIKMIEKRLEKVDKQREQGRRSRQRAEIPTVSLVGYTNAGKSTLFNRMTTGDVYAADQLFATLDPTLRKVLLPDGTQAILADTVGFIRHLPHDLVAAFKATLKESREADLLIHVIDAADENREGNIEQVMIVLKEIGACDGPMLSVYNKIDQMPDVKSQIKRDDLDVPSEVWISAKENDGIELLKSAISQRLGVDIIDGDIILPMSEGQLRSYLYQGNFVSNESMTDQGEFCVSVKIPVSDWKRLERKMERNLSQYVTEFISDVEQDDYTD
jgi:GTPase